jgi:1-phosphatidylinositol-3-phosphate 5-kinase
VKITKGGKETKMDVLVMENLLYGRHISQIYDLKGSVRSRYNADAASDTGKSKVKLDQNLMEEMPTNPLYVGKNAKRLLERAIWNDTHFLSVRALSLLDAPLIHVWFV